MSRNCEPGSICLSGYRELHAERERKKSVIRDEHGGDGQSDPINTLTLLTDRDSTVQSLKKEALVLFPWPGPRASVF